MQFGAHLSNPQHYYYEQYFAASFSTVIGSGASWNTDITSLTMPWYGDVLVDGYAQFEYTASLIEAEVWPATDIAPSNYFVGKTCEFDANGGWIVVPFCGRWAGLGAGTYFKLTIQLKVGASNGTATFRSFVGMMRAQAA